MLVILRPGEKPSWFDAEGLASSHLEFIEQEGREPVDGSELVRWMRVHIDAHWARTAEQVRTSTPAYFGLKWYLSEIEEGRRYRPLWRADVLTSAWTDAWSRREPALRVVGFMTWRLRGRDHPSVGLWIKRSISRDEIDRVVRESQPAPAATPPRIRSIQRRDGLLPLAWLCSQPGHWKSGALLGRRAL